MKAKLKLFIWTNFEPHYTSRMVFYGGLAFAIAKDEKEARKLVTKEYPWKIHQWGKLEVRRIDYRVARAVSGGG